MTKVDFVTGIMSDEKLKKTRDNGFIQTNNKNLFKSIKYKIMVIFEYLNANNT